MAEATLGKKGKIVSILFSPDQQALLPSPRIRESGNEVLARVNTRAPLQFRTVSEIWAMTIESLKQVTVPPVPPCHTSTQHLHPFRAVVKDCKGKESSLKMAAQFRKPAFR
jgi:hypothetical protein